MKYKTTFLILFLVPLMMLAQTNDSTPPLNGNTQQPQELQPTNSIAPAGQQPYLLILDSCKAMGLRNQSKVKNAALSVESARHTRMAALTKYFPQINATAMAFRTINPLIDFSTKESNAQINLNATYKGKTAGEYIQLIQQRLDQLGVHINVQEWVNSFVDGFDFEAQARALNKGAFATATMMQPIFVGGRIIHGNQLAKIGVEAAELQLLISQDEVVLNIEQNYWMVASLKEKMKTVDQAISLLDTLRHDVEAATDAGVLGKTDLLKVKLKQNEMRSNQLQLQNGIRLATQALCTQIGLTYSDSVDYILADTLSINMSAQQILSQFDGDLLRAPSSQNRKEAQLLEMRSHAQHLMELMTLGEAMPQVAVGASLMTYNMLGTNQQNGFIFATINVPLTAWWETGHNLAKQRIQYEQNENEREELVKMMQLQNQQALNDVTEAAMLLDVKAEAVDEAEANMIEVRNYYDAGMLSVRDYLEGQTTLQVARDEWVAQSIKLQTALLRYRQLTQ